MSKSVVKRGTIKLGIYETTVDIYVMESENHVVPQARKIIKRHKSQGLEIEDDTVCNGFAILIEDAPLKGYLIYCKEALSVNIVTHETDHMRKYILDFKDIDDHEASANLNAYINQEVFRFLRKAGFEITY